MSGTRSPSLKAPATKAAIIVSHGQPSDPDPAEAALAQLSTRVAEILPDWQIASATLAAPGALDSAVAAVGRGAAIYPLFMTDGWFTRTTLPNRLNDETAKILAPLGADTALPEIAQAWLLDELKQKGWTAQETCLVIASHGSGKSRNSARDTQRFADRLATRIQFGDTRIGFIEEAPFLGDVVFDTGKKSICLPFFAAGGGHVTDDIPEALDLAEFAGLRLQPIGTRDTIPTLIANALRTYAQQTEAA